MIKRWIGLAAVFAMRAAALAAPVLVASPAAAQDKPTFVFTAIPDQDQTRLVERFTRVAEYLQAKLGVPVKYVPVKSYPAAVTAFTNNEVQLAWFGGFTGVQAPGRASPGRRATGPGTKGGGTSRGRRPAHAAGPERRKPALPRQAWGATSSPGREKVE